MRVVERPEDFESALAACLDSVRSGGAVPAITAVVDGEARVGLDPDEHGRILEADTKTSRRDLGVAIGARWPVGATTVAASLRLAALAARLDEALLALVNALLASEAGPEAAR